MPKIVDRDKKRSDITRKAMEILAQRGFQATTIQEIATAAGIGKGTLYHYFNTKEEILLAVSEEIFSRMEQSLGVTLLRLDEPAERLEALIQECLQVTPEMEHLFIVYVELWLMNFHGNHYEDFIHILKKLNDDMRAIVGKMIEEGQQKGLWAADIDADALAVYLMTSFDGVVFNYLMDKTSFDIEKVTREFIRFFFRQMKATSETGRP